MYRSKFFPKIIVFLAALVSFASLQACKAPVWVKKANSVTVLSLTDFHGALEGYQTETKAGDTVQSGGVGLLYTYASLIKKNAEGPVVILSGGDLFQGTLVSNTFEGKPVIDFYNQLGLTAAALGNHEFDYGPLGKKSVPNSAKDDPRGALKERANEASFPFLAANVITDQGSVPSFIKPSILIERKGIKIGIIGAATIDTPNTTIRANLEGLQFIDPVAPISAEAKKLRNQGADLVILTMHAGGHCEDNSVGNEFDLSTCSNDELFAVIKGLPSGSIDFAIGGHTHRGVSKFVNGVAVLQSFSRGSHMGWATYSLKTKQAKFNGLIPICSHFVPSKFGPTCYSKDVAKHDGPAVPVNFLGETISDDGRIKQSLDHYLSAVDKIKKEFLGLSANDWINRDYYNESGLGNLIADAMKEFLPDTPIGMTNNGGIRENIPPGMVRYGTVFSVLPFDNRLARLKVNGEMLKKLLELGVSKKHGGLSWSGLSFEATKGKVSNIQINGHPFSASKIYSILTNDYLATGGSGFAGLGILEKDIEILDQYPNLRDAVVEVLKSWKVDLSPLNFFDPANPRQQILVPVTLSAGSSGASEVRGSN